MQGDHQQQTPRAPNSQLAPLPPHNQLTDRPQRRTKMTARKGSGSQPSMQPCPPSPIRAKPWLCAMKRQRTNENNNDAAAVARPEKKSRRGENVLMVKRRPDGLKPEDGAWYTWRGQASADAAEVAMCNAEDLAAELTARGVVAASKALTVSMVSSSCGDEAKKGGGYWFNLPSKFGEAIASAGTRKITLVYDDGNGDKEWEVVDRVKDNHQGGAAKSHGFSGGWVFFSIDNKLYPGDSIVLERETDDRIRAHVFRASDYDEAFVPGSRPAAGSVPLPAAGSSPVPVITPPAVSKKYRRIKKEVLSEEEVEEEDEEDEEEYWLSRQKSKRPQAASLKTRRPPNPPNSTNKGTKVNANGHKSPTALPPPPISSPAPLLQVKKEPVPLPMIVRGSGPSAVNESELISAAKALFPDLSNVEDGPPLGYIFDDPPLPRREAPSHSHPRVMMEAEEEGGEAQGEAEQAGGEVKGAVNPPPTITLPPPQLKILPPVTSATLPVVLGNEIVVVTAPKRDDSDASITTNKLYERSMQNMFDALEEATRLRRENEKLKALLDERDRDLAAIKSTVASLEKDRVETKSLVSQLRLRGSKIVKNIFTV